MHVTIQLKLKELKNVKALVQIAGMVGLVSVDMNTLISIPQVHTLKDMAINQIL